MIVGARDDGDCGVCPDGNGDGDDDGGDLYYGGVGGAGGHDDGVGVTGDDCD